MYKNIMNKSGIIDPHKKVKFLDMNFDMMNEVIQEKRELYFIPFEYEWKAQGVLM